MAEPYPPPPPGFQVVPGTVPPPPPGFVVQPAKPQVGVLEDVGRAAVSGGARGVMAIPGMIGDLPDAGAAVTNWVQGVFGVPEKDRVDPAWFQKNAPWLPNTADIENAVGFKAYEPQTDIGRYVQTGAEFLPGAATMGAGGLVRAVAGNLGREAVALGARQAATNAAKYGVGGGLMSEGGGDLAVKVTGKEEARLPGQVLGGVFGPAAASRAITPFPATARQNAAVDVLRGEGVDALTAGERTGNLGLRYWESTTGGARVAQAMEDRSEQYTRAVLSRAGIQANRADTDVVDAAFTRIGRDFDGLATRNTLTPDHQLDTDLLDTIHAYEDVVGPPNRAPAVDNYFTEISNKLGAGAPIPGAEYQSLRSRILATAKDANPEARRALNDLRESLDDAMERSIQATNPEDLGAWAQARREYRNMLVIERAATAAHAESGLITPANLRVANQAVAGRRAVARGQTDFDELARSGSVVMKPLPQSGTQPRAQAAAFNAAPSVIGAMIGSGASAGDMTATLAGATAGAGASKVARALAFSQPGRAYLGNQILGGANITPGATTVASALNNATMPVRLPDGRPFDDVAATLARRRAQGAAQLR